MPRWSRYNALDFGTVVPIRKPESPPPESPPARAPDPVPRRESAPPKSSAPPVRPSTPRQPSAPPETSTPPESSALPLWFRLPHAVIDDILPTLEPSEQAIYLQLLRLSWGHRREVAKVGMARLAERANVGKSTARGVLRKLEKRGLVEVLSVDFGGGGTSGGALYRVSVPGVDAAEFLRAPKSGGVPKVSAPPESSAMKDSERKETEKADLTVYDVRRIAARFVELHRGEASYTKDRLRADVRTALVGEGREVEPGLLEAAIG
jgi:DNA-binding transcriptional ArsR family regulator